MLISDSQLAISSVCRGFNYYVDPTSTAVLELGTLQYPYKSLAFVFVELLNFHANTARTINVYLKENTQNYIDLSFNYIINITSVTITSYSATSSSPSKATIIAGETNDPSQANITAYYSSSTIFNLLVSTALNTQKQIFSNPLLSSTELSYLSQKTQVIVIQRSAFSISNITLSSTFKDITSGYKFFFPIYLQDRSFRMTDIDSRTSGGILVTYDPMNVYLENIDIDYSRNSFGFTMIITCNYPEAYLYATLNATNVKYYYSQSRLVPLLTGKSFSASMPGTVNITGLEFNTYSTESDQISNFGYKVTPY